MYTEEPSVRVFNPEFAAKVREKQRRAVLASSGEKLAAISAKTHAEREKLVRMRKAANDAVRAANEAIRALQHEYGASTRAHVGNPRTMASIVSLVSRATGVSPKDIHGPRRARKIVLARQAVMYWCIRRTNKSYPQIGRFLGSRDHTTILHGVSVYVEKRAYKGRNLRRVR